MTIFWNFRSIVYINIIVDLRNPLNLTIFSITLKLVKFWIHLFCFTWTPHLNGFFTVISSNHKFNLCSFWQNSQTQQMHLFSFRNMESHIRDCSDILSPYAPHRFARPTWEFLHQRPIEVHRTFRSFYAFSQSYR